MKYNCRPMSYTTSVLNLHVTNCIYMLCWHSFLSVAALTFSLHIEIVENIRVL